MQIGANKNQGFSVYIEVICKCCPRVSIAIWGGEGWKVGIGVCMDCDGIVVSRDL